MFLNLTWINAVADDQAPQYQRSVGVLKNNILFLLTYCILLSVRNNLLEGSYIKDGSFIIFSDIRLVYEGKNNKFIRAVPNITEPHFPNNIPKT